MFYKLYRRRSKIYIIIIVILLFIYFSLNDDDKSVKKSDYESDDGKKLNGKRRITMETYVPPAPCGDCPGENGQAVFLTPEEEVGIDEVYKKEFFNLRASDKISLWRTLPDVRNSVCRNKKYPEDLPTASVVIIFKNERWSPVLRTVYSVLNRSPRHLLKEIILVDDQSDLDELKQKLEDYCEEHFGEIVRILRTPKRLGLIAAKNFGGRNATGDVVVFLDAHCEASDGWLEPILGRIKEKRDAILCPAIDSIDKNNMGYFGGDAAGYGIFTWSLFFDWGQMPDRLLQKYNLAYDPYPSPTMAGGLLAADRKYFFEIGGYDDEMEVWGGENLELSFRTWMCGGSLEFVPCSHVGHIFRPGHPYNMTGEKGKGDVHGRNSMRLAEVWMDDYKRLYYSHRRDLIGKDFGDVSSRIEIRKRLNCHSFKWFLDNVYPEMFVFDENVYGYGEVRNTPSLLCLDTFGKDDKRNIELGVFFCQGGVSAYQVFSLSHNDELRRETICCFAENNPGSIVKLTQCNGMSNQKWSHDKNGPVVHKDSGLCLDITDVNYGEYAKVQTCEPTKIGQKWEFQHYEK